METKKAAALGEKGVAEARAHGSKAATNIVASKYFHGKLGTPERETSVAQLVHRVTDTIADWGHQGGYFLTVEDGENFPNELAHLLLTPKAGFISPLWVHSPTRAPPRY